MFVLLRNWPSCDLGGKRVQMLFVALVLLRGPDLECFSPWTSMVFRPLTRQYSMVHVAHKSRTCQPVGVFLQVTE